MGSSEVKADLGRNLQGKKSLFPQLSIVDWQGTQREQLGPRLLCRGRSMTVYDRPGFVLIAACHLPR